MLNSARAVPPAPFCPAHRTRELVYYFIALFRSESPSIYPVNTSPNHRGFPHLQDEVNPFFFLRAEGQHTPLRQLHSVIDSALEGGECHCDRASRWQGLRSVFHGTVAVSRRHGGGFCVINCSCSWGKALECSMFGLLFHQRAQHPMPARADRFHRRKQPHTRQGHSNHSAITAAIAR